MDEKEGSQKNPGSSVLSIIPQVFYDFIARVIPGSLVIIIGFITYQGALDKSIEIVLLNKDKLPSPFPSICLGLIISYGISIILWRQIDWIRFLYNRKVFSAKKSSARESANLYIYDFIKTKDYSVGSRLTKHRAEKHMTEILATGFIYCLIFNTIQIFIHLKHPDDNRVF